MYMTEACWCFVSKRPGAEIYGDISILPRLGLATNGTVDGFKYESRGGGGGIEARESRRPLNLILVFR